MFHLHLHFEPAERIHARDAYAAVGRDNSSGPRERFFQTHALGRPDAERWTLCALEGALRGLLAEQVDQGVTHLEVRLSPERWLRAGMLAEDFYSTVERVLLASDGPDFTARFVLLLNRSIREAKAWELLEAAVEWSSASLVGLDLAGDELAHPEIAHFASLFESARDQGLGVTVHAGEFGPASQVWDAIDVLGADRVAHALSAVHEPALIDRLALDCVPIEVAVGSNVALGAVESLGEHPVRRFIEGGVRVCFNSDVPMYLGTDLRHELSLAAQATNLELGEVHEIQSSAADFAFYGPRKSG